MSSVNDCTTLLEIQNAECISPHLLDVVVVPDDVVGPAIPPVVVEPVVVVGAAVVVPDDVVVLPLVVVAADVVVCAVVEAVGKAIWISILIEQICGPYKKIGKNPVFPGFEGHMKKLKCNKTILTAES